MGAATSTAAAVAVLVAATNAISAAQRRPTANAPFAGAGVNVSRQGEPCIVHVTVIDSLGNDPSRRTSALTGASIDLDNSAASDGNAAESSPSRMVSPQFTSAIDRGLVEADHPALVVDKRHAHCQAFPRLALARALVVQVGDPPAKPDRASRMRRDDVQQLQRVVV